MNVEWAVHGDAQIKSVLPLVISTRAIQEFVVFVVGLERDETSVLEEPGARRRRLFLGRTLLDST